MDLFRESGLPDVGGKGIYWRNRSHNLKDLFILCYQERF